MIALAALPQLARAVLHFLRSPVGIVVTAAGLVLGGYVGGHHAGTVRERAACEQAKAESFAAARAIDAAAADEAKRRADRERQESTVRQAEMQQRIDDYAKDHRSCAVGDDGARFLDGVGGVRDQPPVRSSKPLPPVRR